MSHYKACFLSWVCFHFLSRQNAAVISIYNIFSMLGVCLQRLSFPSLFRSLLPWDWPEFLVRLVSTELLERFNDHRGHAEGDDEERELEADARVVDVLVRWVGEVVLEAG